MDGAAKSPNLKVMQKQFAIFCGTIGYNRLKKLHPLNLTVNSIHLIYQVHTYLH